jgi:SSS family transporter
MQFWDWVVLLGTQLFIILFGIWKVRQKSNNLQSHLLDKELSWFGVGISIMATQASAITFLSTPGQAYGNGMGFVQIYLGMPLAMIVLSATFVPIYHRLQVYTAYEYLERRFDVRVRMLTAFLFLLQRGAGAGLSIYAPALILTTVLGWKIDIFNLLIGVSVVIYTVIGGAKAVNQTQKLQMATILIGMVAAGVLIFQRLPSEISLPDALHVAGKMERLNPIDFEFDLSQRYNVWSGILGGFFLSLSYFGTDHSQVQRYLGAKTLTESRLGLLMNGILKIPMQFMILSVGVLLFVFYQFEKPVIYFNQNEYKNYIAQNPTQAPKLEALEKQYQANFEAKKEALLQMLQEKEGEIAPQTLQKLREKQAEHEQIRNQVIGTLISTPEKEADEKSIKTKRNSDLDYAFIGFILDKMPMGLVGLLISVMLSAAMSSASSELSALSSATLLDLYKRNFKSQATDAHYLKAGRLLTALWGLYAILFAQMASRLENLIQAVNILGSLFYGVVLGIFLVAFFLKKVRTVPLLWAACLSQGLILLHYFFLQSYFKLEYLWYNLIGCGFVLLFSWLFNQIFKQPLEQVSKQENKIDR